MPDRLRRRLLLVLLARLDDDLVGVARDGGRRPEVQINRHFEFWARKWAKLWDNLSTMALPGPQDKRLTGNGEKLTYSCPAGCN